MTTMEKSHIILQGDALSLAQSLPSGKISSCITSPPYYGLRSYQGEQTILWPETRFRLNEWTPEIIYPGCDPDCEHEWVELPPRSGGAGNAPDKPSGFQQKSRAGQSGELAQMSLSSPGTGSYCAHCGGWRGSLGLEPDPVMFIGHLVLIFREVRRILHDSGTLWVVIGDSWNGSGGPGGWVDNKQVADFKGEFKKYDNPNRDVVGIKPKDKLMIPAMFALAMRADGWYLRQEIVWAKGVSFCPTYSGSSMPESVKDRPSYSMENVYLFSKKSRYFYDSDAVKELASTPMDSSAKQSFGGPKLNTGELAHTNNHGKAYRDERSQYRNLRSVWTINPQGFDGGHHAVFPEKLVEPMILASTSEVGNCPECGAPWRRIVERKAERTNPKEAAQQRRRNAGVQGGGTEAVTLGVTASVTRKTVGWEPTCNHGHDPVPAVVLDIFLGSGTTAAVAIRHGRHAMGFELNEEYIRLSLDRIAQVKLEMKIELPPLEKQMENLPLFSMMEESHA